MERWTYCSLQLPEEKKQKGVLGFLLGTNSRTRENGTKLIQWSFNWLLGKCSLHGEWSTTETVSYKGSLGLSKLKRHLDNALGIMFDFQLALKLSGGWIR